MTSAAAPPIASREELSALLADRPARDDARVTARADELARPDDALVERAVALLDLTRLEADDTPTTAHDLAVRAAELSHGQGPAPAGVCVWSDLVGDVATRLAGTGVRAVAVAGAFPTARSPLHVRVAEVTAAVASGADEIDLVLDRGALRERREWDAAQQVAALRAAAGGVPCKAILETGALPDLDTVGRAARVALAGGADLLKTSTGKQGPGASAGAVLVLLEEADAFARHTGRRIGVKAAGGIRAADDATALLALARAVVGDDWLVPDRFRLGGSSLLDALLERRNGTGR